MDANICKVNNRLNADALLPPRKRLLAGLKRQNSEITSPSPSKDDTPVSTNPFIPQLSNSSLSDEGIVEASTIAAKEYAKIAVAARAKAEEKAEKAAKAFSAARNALDIVASLSDEAPEKGMCPKATKMRKHTSVQELYNKKRKCGRVTNSKTDEELARNLHRAINSSPRILKNSDTEIRKYKKTKVGTEGTVMVGLNASKLDKSDQLMLNNGEGVSSGKNKQTKVGDSEVLDECGRKRGRIKQKKLPLSVCSFRDRTGLKEDGVTVGIDGDLFSSGNKLVSDDRASMWKCQSLKVMCSTE